MLRRYLLFGVLVMLTVGLTLNSNAEPKKKKKSTANMAQTPPVDSSANAGAANAAAAAPAAAPAPAPVAPAPEEKPAPRIITLGDSTKINLDNLVADSAGAFVDNFVIDTTKPSDGFYKATTLRGAKPYPFPEENVNNIKKFKRIWRQIDLTDSVNRIFAVPGETLMGEIMNAIKEGRLVAYSDPEFKKTVTYEQAIGKFRDSISSPIIDQATGDVIGTKQELKQFIPDSITTLEIKEDIYFDKVRGRVVTEIISFAPMKKFYNSSGVRMAEFDTRAFYLYFKQLRKLLAAREVTDLPRDISNVSYDDLFISRNFHSKIVKEASPSDLKIADKFHTEEEQKKESDRIEKEIRDFKRGMFKYY